MYYNSLYLCSIKIKNTKMKSEIMKKAWEIKRATSCTMSEALKQAWAMVITVTETIEVIGKTKIVSIYYNGVLDSYEWFYVGKCESSFISKSFKKLA